MLLGDLLQDVYINEPSIHRKARQICLMEEALTQEERILWLTKAIGLIDLTTLGGDDTPTNVEALCEKAVKPIDSPDESLSKLHTAAVCVYPLRVPDAVKALKELDKNKKVAIAAVAAGFPSGQYPLETRCKEVELAIQNGATEIDLVINRSLALSHQWTELYDELKTIHNTSVKAQTLGEAEVHLKTILATGELISLKDVYKASMVAMVAGTHFIKTSTGKETVNATLPVGLVMCRAIKDYYRLTKTKVGFKPAGGIKTAQDALQWMMLVHTELGDSWLNPQLFRLGASSLLDNIVKTIA